ncbi:SRPBCC domain-containing protein [Sphingobacterium pedocola]|uniref:ATPase n=1 Tax=Sphingobacterium pedocola TaxID=2082722 RepID=A0ABR9TB26_9SPHI|nr:SRPBCC domain-containing protein [Sphingobacterium pedocola]MBE8722534.1 ATPase [Sphingobacterium pedocola]
MEKNLVAKAAIQIQKPIAEVFEAIIDPEKMSRYFISKSTGRLDTSNTVEWSFPEFEGAFPVEAREIQPFSYISFDWSGGAEDMLVEVFLEPQENNSTVVRVKEKQMKADENGIQQAIGQSEGWANFLACLKAYLEYGINLRKGAFDFRKED